MRTFHGRRTEAGGIVTVETGPGQSWPLDPRLDLRNHSPTGFEWGYHGSGPSRLALAICAAVVGAERAGRIYQEFKERVIAPIRSNEWWLDEAAVFKTIEMIEKEVRV